MGRLTIIENDVGIMEREDSYFMDVKFRDGSTNVDPDTVIVSIEYPCDSGTDSASITTTATTGNWQGAWEVPSSATYGEYIVTYTAVYNSNTYKFTSFFYILPWNITEHIRAISGIKQSNDINDRDLAIIAWNSYVETKEQVFRKIINEDLSVNAYHCINGNNTEFFTKKGNLVTDHLICDEVAIKGTYYDVNQDKQQLTVSIDTAITGEITVQDKDGNALTCDDCCCPKITYRVKSYNFTEQLFKKAVVYLASHEVILRFNELDKATLADLNSNKPVILANPDRMREKYKETVRRIKKIKVGGVK
jgi:hypothetical protein